MYLVVSSLQSPSRVKFVERLTVRLLLEISTLPIIISRHRILLDLIAAPDIVFQNQDKVKTRFYV